MKFSGLGKGLESLIPKTTPITQKDISQVDNGLKTKESIFLILETG